MLVGWYKKILVVGIIVLFVSTSVQPAFAFKPRISNDASTYNRKEEIEPKDYLFETIIKIAENPDVKELLEEYGYNSINFEFDYEYVFRQLLFKNPNLLFSIVFTNPKMTTRYYNKIYNQGIELIDIFGEKKALEMLESVEITNTKLLNDLNSIIMNDDELYNRISTLELLNNDTSSICDILFIIFWRTLFKLSFYEALLMMYILLPILSTYFFIRCALLFPQFIISIQLLIIFDCIEFPPDTPYEIDQIVSI
jgi:hypothetical protein